MKKIPQSPVPSPQSPVPPPTGLLAVAKILRFTYNKKSKFSVKQWTEALSIGDLVRLEINRVFKYSQP